MPADSPPTEYEYRLLETRKKMLNTDFKDPSRKMNKLGMNGWELVETLDKDEGGTQALIFKRPLTKERKRELENKEEEKSGLGGLLSVD